MRPKLIRALVDVSKHEYATGLTPKDIEMLKAKGVQYDLSPSFSDSHPHEFWDSSTATIKLGIKPFFLDTENPLDYIKYHILLASKYVANSMREYEEGLYPYATHVIYNEFEEVEEKASRLALRNQAIVKCYKLSLERKKALLMILTGTNYDGKSQNTVDVALEAYIEKDAQKVLDQLSRTDDEIVLHALILQAVMKDIIRHIDGVYKFGEVLLGDSLEKSILFLKDVKNQKVRIKLLKSVQTP